MFLKANQQILAGWMVWLFSSGPTGEGDPIQLVEGWQQPDHYHHGKDGYRYAKLDD